jgi:radical SAM protein with 4Fe4S-binding SPASM domain
MFGKWITGTRNSIWSATYRPADAIIFLTYRCTSRCSACNIWRRPVDKSEELTWEQWEPIFEDLAATGIRSVELFGGDALLRKPLLLKMIRFCTENDIATFFPTNSSSLTKNIVGDLVEAGLGTVYLSLDEIPEMGTSVRGVKRHFERATEGIAKFVDARGEQRKPRISCITTVSSLNYQYVPDLLQVAYEAGADEYMVRGISEFTDLAVAKSAVEGVCPSPFYMSTNEHTHAFSYEQAVEFLAMLGELKSRRSEYAPMSIDTTNIDGLTEANLENLEYPRQTCAFATTKVVISPYGNVLPCLHYKNYHLGNLGRESAKNIWGNSKHRKFCGAQRKGEIPLCDQCSIKAYHKTLGTLVKDGFRSIGASRG